MAHESFRKEIVVLWVLLLHKHQIFAKFVFVSNYLNTRPLGDPLIGLYPIEDIWSDRKVEPANIKVLWLWHWSHVIYHLIGVHMKLRIHHSKSHVHGLARISNYRIYCVVNVYC